MSNHRLHWSILLAVFAIPAVIVGIFPSIDLVVSGWFYQPGRGFVKSPVLEWMHHMGPGLLIAAALLSALVLLWRKRITVGETVFVAASFLLGPGLLVNAVLKEHYGRARPVQVEPFGGGAHFTYALHVADQCHHNCSFTAGDPSVGFALIAFALVMPKKRDIFTAFALFAGSALGLLRIAQGGHFLSDVLFTAVVTIGSTLALFRVWPGKDRLS